ncbi:beta-Ala-His dipeptidase [Gaiella sp.]|uniref:beta-Ala-His dipeptidase n=1 Tax=Gaiella sp. TaxID=2663207 RepID=UPI002E33B612|nr:beta-Ala-His dipeptidase [Gaiella sp.]HEX5583069.1 beta-Ala-His dipeptidase [Gaiella sp.]
MATETSALTGLEPRAFWAHFEALTRIARPSRGEEPAIEHVRRWADERGLGVRQDEGRNVVIDVPATPGREDAPTVTLQGHLDIVCERDPASPNDPAEGRIALVRDGDWLTADGTTLGADDGVAIAAMMALVEDESLAHGPLALLMTVAEEVGLEGANALDPSLVTGSILLNLDSEEDGKLTVGCAGSTDTWIRIDAPREPAVEGAVPLVVTVRGGQGGHSGMGIGLGRSNAVKVLGRALREASGTVRFGLVSFQGGKSRNAIPRDAVAICSVASDDEQAFRAAVSASAEAIRDAFAKTDPGVSIAVDTADAPAAPWSAEATARLLDAIALVPTGPLALSPDFDDLVETSTSLGEALTEGDRLTLHSLSRSSNDSALPEVISTLDAVARLAGGELEVKVNYGGWRPDMDSPTLAAARATFERLFGDPPVVTAVHAGLETAVIGSKVHGLDMLSFGPQIEFPHSPDERVSIPTVERFWRLLVALVDELSRPG